VTIGQDISEDSSNSSEIKRDDGLVGRGMATSGSTLKRYFLRKVPENRYFGCCKSSKHKTATR